MSIKLSTDSFTKGSMVKKKTLKKKCDKLFSLTVRKHGRCQFFGLDKVHCSKVLQCAHIETRGISRLRFDQQNALCLCSGHHWYYTNHPKDFDAMVEEYFPSQWKYVQEHRHERKNYSIEDYQNFIKELT
jgi:hypothetical protein